MSVVLSAPEQIATGTPIPFSFSSQTRVSGRVRLTHGTEALSFRLERGPEDISAVAAGHRIRGKHGAFKIRDWGEHPSGTELVLRFEGRKIWMTVG